MPCLKLLMTAEVEYPANGSDNGCGLPLTASSLTSAGLIGLG